MSDLEYAVNVVLLIDDPGDLYAFFDRLNDRAAMLRMHSSPSQCKMLWDSVGSKSNRSHSRFLSGTFPDSNSLVGKQITRQLQILLMHNFQSKDLYTK